MRGLLNPISSWWEALKVEIQLDLLLLRHPSLKVQRPSVWRYDTAKALEIGCDVAVGSFSEIIAYSKTRRSRVPGKLVIGSRVYIGAGCNVRAAGGIISIGDDTLIAQHVSIVAANHSVALNKTYRDLDWDQNKTGVTIGSNCWIGAHCVILPGVTIGNGSVIGAGSVVTKSVPENSIWVGVPARPKAQIPERQ